MKNLLLYIIIVFTSFYSNILAFEEDHLNNLLNNKDCMQCDFSGANLSDIKLKNIDISGSNFENAILKYSSFENVNLSNVNLSFANMENVSIR